MLNQYRLKLEVFGSSGKGVFILGKKEKQQVV